VRGQIEAERSQVVQRRLGVKYGEIFGAFARGLQRVALRHFAEAKVWVTIAVRGALVALALGGGHAWDPLERLYLRQARERPAHEAREALA